MTNDYTMTYMYAGKECEQRGGNYDEPGHIEKSN